MKEKIKISDNGSVFIPHNVQMNITQIADLFEVNQAVAKKCIRQIEKQAVIKSYNTSSCLVEGDRIVCDYYDLETIVAISFQLQSIKARLFREWILQRLVAPFGYQILELHDWKNISLN